MGFIIWVNILVLAFWQHFCCSQGHSEYHAATPCAKLKPNCPLSTRSHTIIYIYISNKSHRAFTPQHSLSQGIRDRNELI